MRFFERFPRSEKSIREEETRRNDDETVSFLKKELARRKSERMAYELRWTLCGNFFMGNQYCDINCYRDMGIEQFLPDDKNIERETFNRIAPIIETRIANLQKVTYAMVVKPRREDLDDEAKAEVSTKILRYWQDVSHFDARKNKAIVYNEICGNAFWVVGWNKEKGRVTARGRKLCEENGELTEKVVDYHEGDVEYSLLSSYEVYPEDCMKEGVENQNSMMVEQVLTAKEVYNRYGFYCDGESVNTFTVTPKIAGYGMGKETSTNTLSMTKKEHSVRVVTYYERGGREYPKGREIVFADYDGGKILYQGELSYGFIPIVQIKCKSVPGQFFGKSAIEELLPLQRAYNDVKNRIHEHIKRIALGTLLVEKGSLDVDMLEQYGISAGQIVEYEPGRNKPSAMPVDNLPSEVLKEAETLERDMEYVAGVSQLQMIGSAPSGITSGSAIESLREIDNTRMAMTSEYIREGAVNLGIMVLKIYKMFARLPRVVNYTGLNDLGNALIWKGSDIESFEVDFETENELVFSEEMQLQRFNTAVQMGFYTDDNGVIPQRVKNMGLEKMKLGKYSELLGMNTLSIEQAKRENTYMRSGMFCDINSYDDDVIHAEEHKRFILSTEYEILKHKKKEWAELILAHYEAHEARIKEKANPKQDERM